MSGTWFKDQPPEALRLTPAGLLRVAVKGGALAVLVFGCLALLLLVRLAERPLFGLHRPVTPFITQFVCRNAFRILGIGFVTHGDLMQGRGAVVANHSSWLDIFALHARKRIYFVSKAEVAGWPGIGWLARATGTVFIERNPRQARDHTDLFTARLMAGHKLLFFPEGTSTDGSTVLPFKTTLFAAFFSHDLRPHMAIQPVTLLYHAPEGARADFYGWWGDMDFGSHLVKVLGRRRQGRVELVYHAPVRVGDFHDRKALAAHVERVIRDCHEKRGLGAFDRT
ncbi:MAG: 1-acyl-sn-glycerol-3-phosphate acyltransferase [Pseudooceanicola sp.]|nr:1-acyl-sn-glycerol-3-phosphate acyltransferase [Pseudooceanicola sp.]